MSFSDVALAQQLLRSSMGMQKEAGVLRAVRKGLGKAIKGTAKAPARAAGAAVKAPFQVAGKGVGLAARGAHRGLWGLSQVGARSMGAKGALNKPLAGVMYGGAVLGGLAAAKKGVSKAREYRQGFDPKYQLAQTYGYGK